MLNRSCLPTDAIARMVVCRSATVYSKLPLDASGRPLQKPILTGQSAAYLHPQLVLLTLYVLWH